MSDNATLDEFAQEVDGYENQKSQNWSEVKLQEVVYKRSENVDPQEVYLDKHVGLEHIEPNSPIPDWESLDDLSSTKRKFESGDILFAKLRPNLEKAAQPEFDGVASTDIFPIVAEQDINQKYLLYRLSSKPAFDYARRTSAGTRMPRTSWNLFNNFEFGLPSLSEQRKIATVLHTVDQAIQKTEQVAEQAERAKRGVIQENVLDRIAKAGSPTELGDVPNEWQTVKLEDVASQQEDSLVDGPFGSSLQAEEFVEDGFARILQLQNVKEGWYSDSNIRYVDKETYEDLERHSAKPSDIFIAKMASPVARACILPNKYEHYMLGCADVVKLIPNGDFVDEFVMYCLNSYPVWKQAAAHIRGSGRLRVNLNQLKDIELPKPPLSEQEKIVTAVNEITNYIQLHKDKKERLDRVKRGLMQELLSGEARTTDADIDIPEEVAKYG